MSSRYIQRYRLPEQVRAADCPVVLEAGALLEDTKLPRLITQLKFRADAPKAVAAVEVGVTGYYENGLSAGTVLFQYQGLSAEKGQIFGPYTAIPLPAGGIVRIEAAVSAVTFADGSKWTPAGGVSAAPRPLKAVSRNVPVAAPKAAPTVQTVTEPEPVPAAVAPSRERTVPAAQTACAAPAQSPAPAVVSAAEQKVVSVAPKCGAANKKGFIIAAVAVIVVAAIAAAAFLLPKGDAGKVDGGGGSNMGGIKQEEVREPVHVTTPSDKGTVYLELEKTGDRYCRLELEMLQSVVPEAVSFSCDDVGNMGNDINTYLAQSYNMLVLISSDGTELANNGYSHVYVEEYQGNYSILLFSDTMKLCGYFVGQPEKLDNGKWEIPITLCDYDFSSFYYQQAAAYEAAHMEELPYILPEDVESCGAEYFLFGYGTGGFHDDTQTQQLYFLWNQKTSPYVDDFCRTMDRLEDRKPEGTPDDPTWRYFLLLDENKEIMGFTLFSAGVSDVFDRSGSVAWDGKVATGFAGGSGIPQDPYRIETAQQLAYLAKLYNGENYMGYLSFRLERNLDLKGLEWMPIGGNDRQFRGSFDGNGHTISGLYVTEGVCEVSDDGSVRTFAGLFGRAYQADICDLRVTGDINITRTDERSGERVEAGGIIGAMYGDGTLVNCSNECGITVELHGEETYATVGGVAGSFHGDYADGCSNKAAITVRVSENGVNAGGLFGNAGETELRNCWNEGTVTAKALTENAYPQAGGIAGSGYDLQVANCCNLGRVESSNRAGGIVCYLSESEERERESVMVNCYSTGDIHYTGPNSRNPSIGSLAYDLYDDSEMHHCFYLENAPAGTPLRTQTEADVSGAQPFRADGTFASGDLLAQVMTSWAGSNSGDAVYRYWESASGNALPLPVG